MKHPSREKIQAYYEKRLNPLAAAVLSRHLANCNECTATLGEIERDSELVEKLRKIGDSPEPEYAASQENILHRLHGIMGHGKRTRTHNSKH